MIPAHTSPILKYLTVILLFSLTVLSISVRPAHAQSSSLGQNTSQGNLIPATFTFQKNLSKGMTLYPDVVYLKKFLGQDPRTALLTDPCISTYADGYFDQATKDAVIKFQELYRNEVLTPAGLRTASGVVGQYSRTKINALLRTPAYATIVASPNTTTTTATQVNLQALQGIIDQYFGQVNQTISNPTVTNTGTTSTTSTVQIASTTNPIVNTYLKLIQERLSTNASTTTATSSLNSYSPIATTTDPIIATYFQGINNTLNNQLATTSISTTSTHTLQIPSNNTTVTANNPVITAYLNSINATLKNLATTSSSTAVGTTTSQISATSTNQGTSTVPSTTRLPRILSASPTVLSNCQQTITIIGENFSPDKTLLVGTIGTLLTSATTIATTSSSTVQAITFKLKDFSDYAYNQAIHSGYTKEIRIVIMADGNTSDDMIILQFTFPGEKRSAAAIAQTIANISANRLYSANSSANSSSGSSATNSTNSSNQSGQNQSPQAILKTIETTDLKIMSKTPQGMLITAIGGEEALKTVYEFTPNGRLNQKLQGNTFGIVSIMNQISGQGSSNSSSGSSGISSGLAAGGGGGGGSGAISNFGGPITMTYTCTCSSNTLLTIQDVRGQSLQLMYQPGVSILYLYGSLTTGAQTLGNYTSGGQCLIYSGYTCTTYGSPIGTITQIGTSK